MDLTSLEKCGKCKAFSQWIHLLQGKRGLHIVVLYLVMGRFRVPWGFRVWRGKGTPSAAQLAVHLLDTLPKRLLKAFRVIILADTALGSVACLQAMRKRRHPLILGFAVTANWQRDDKCVTWQKRDNRTDSMACPSQ